jgi:hypothetical protein
MIHDQDLPILLWENACNTTIYFQKGCSHKILENKTPEEEFICVKLEVSHFCIFGCPIYIHVLVEKRTKLDPSIGKGLFMGYNETSKAHKVYIRG